MSAIVSQDKLYVNGVSSDTVGLYIDTPPMPPMPRRKYTEHDIPGRSECIVSPEMQYEDITITVKAYVFDYGYTPNDIYSFISSAKTISFNDLGYFWKVKKVLGIIPSHQNHGKQHLQIQFVCSPFRWNAENDPITAMNDNTNTVVNLEISVDGNVYCEPLIVLYGVVGDVVVSVNSVELSITDLTGDIYIDIPRRKIYTLDSRGNKVVVLNHSVGKLWEMVLVPSDTEMNYISIGKNVAGYSITKNERWI